MGEPWGTSEVLRISGFGRESSFQGTRSLETDIRVHIEKLKEGEEEKNVAQLV